MEPWANSVMDDISATISPMREELVFAFIISIYRKYAYYIIIRVVCVELFLTFSPGWDSAVRANGRGSAPLVANPFGAPSAGDIRVRREGLQAWERRCTQPVVLSRQGRLKTEACLDGEAQTRTTRPSGSSPGPKRRSDVRFPASDGQQFTPARNGLVLSE